MRERDTDGYSSRKTETGTEIHGQGQCERDCDEGTRMGTLREGQEQGDRYRGGTGTRGQGQKQGARDRE